MATKISIVTPTHSRPELLKSLLDSIQKQQLDTELFEMIIVGDQSDSSASLISKWQQEFNFQITYKCLTNDPWNGKNPSAKRNYGVSLAQYDWIAFTDDDCVASEQWLESASQFLDSHSDVAAIEGGLKIPEMSYPTLTYKGLKRMESSGGYQTCNMFYRKDIFNEIGGFDLGFPFYLEDTDLAWSVIDKGFEIPFLSEAIISHPVVPAQPQRLLDNSLRLILVPYLFTKHERLFIEAKIKPIPRGSLAYIGLYVLCIALALSFGGWGLLAGLKALLLFAVGHNLYRFRGCHFTIKEFLLTTMYSLICPIVAYVQLIRGNLKYGTRLIF